MIYFECKIQFKDKTQKITMQTNILASFRFAKCDFPFSQIAIPICAHQNKQIKQMTARNITIFELQNVIAALKHVCKQ